MVLKMFKLGFNNILAIWKVFVIYYIFLLIIGFSLTMPLNYTVISEMAKSYRSNLMMESFDLASFVEVIINVYPGVIKYYSASLIVLVFIIILASFFLSGGVLSSYINKENSVRKFFSEGIKYYFSIMKAFFLILLCYVMSIVLFLLISKFRRVVIDERGWEVAHYIILLFSVILLVFFVNFFAMLFDYIKIYIVRNNVSKARIAFKEVFSLIWHNLGKTLFLYYIIIFIEIVILFLLILSRSIIQEHSISSIIIVIIISQMMMVVRIITRLLRYSAQNIMFGELMKQEVMSYEEA